MRITMGMISKQYSQNLNRTLGALNDAGTRSANFRKFNKASEDPFSASKAFRLRREYQQNQDYQNNADRIKSMLASAESCVDTVNEIAQEAGAEDVLKAINGTMSSSDRSAIATKLRTMQEAIVSAMNTKFGDKYLFGGSDSDTPPFSVDADGNLLYRGINVDTGVNSNGATTNIGGTMICFGAANTNKLNGYTVTIEQGADAGSGVSSVEMDANNIKITLNADGATSGQLQEALRDGLDDAFALAGLSTDGIDFSAITVGGSADASVGLSEVDAGVTQQSAISDIVDLSKLADEKIYADLGFGLKLNADGAVQPQSAFNVSMPGISYLGYGTSGDGVPNNLHSLLGDIADMLESEDFSMDGIAPYLSAFDNSEQGLLTKMTDIGARSNALEYAQTRLTKAEDSMLEEIDSVEYVEPVDAIMDYKMQEYAYMASLQIGTSILQPTFLDFMD